MALFQSHHQHFLHILLDIYWKPMLKIIFIHKTGVYIMFGRSGMVLNVDCRDIRAIEPFQNSDSHTRFKVVRTETFCFGWVCAWWTYVKSTVLHTFEVDKDAKVTIYQPFVSKLRTRSLTEAMDVPFHFNINTIFEGIFVNITK